MKKILAFMLVVILCLSLCGCMGTSQQQSTVTYKDFEGGAVGTPDEFPAVASSDESSADEAKYKNDLRGLCTYLKDKNCVFDYEDAIVTDASLIGADDGYKFMYKFEDGEVVLEVYSYSKTDSEWYQQAKANGEITLLGVTFEAILSENGKYLMVYSDSKNRTERKDAIIDVFNSFYSQAK